MSWIRPSLGVGESGSNLSTSVVLAGLGRRWSGLGVEGNGGKEVSMWIGSGLSVKGAPSGKSQDCSSGYYREGTGE